MKYILIWPEASIAPRNAKRQKGFESMVEVFSFASWCYVHLGGGLKNFLMFTPKLGEDEPNLTVAYFSNGLAKNHQLVYMFERNGRPCHMGVSLNNLNNGTPKTPHNDHF